MGATAIVGASELGFAAGQTFKKSMIAKTSCQFEREPMVRPFGFKGGYLTEEWIVSAYVRSTSGLHGIGLGTQSSLWSDAKVFARCLAGGVREGADKLARVPQGERGPLVPLLLEAAVLKAEYLEMAADGMLGHAIRPIPYGCARQFYSREMCPQSVEWALRRVYQGYESNQR